MQKEILFVEDDDDVRELFGFILREAGFTVVEVGRAEAALEAIDQRLPDVILLDMFMPPGEMSGIELLARLREQAGWAAVPVVVFSGFGDVINRDLMARLGVRAVLLKSAGGGPEVVRAVQMALSA